MNHFRRIRNGVYRFFVSIVILTPVKSYLAGRLFNSCWRGFLAREERNLVLLAGRRGRGRFSLATRPWALLADFKSSTALIRRRVRRRSGARGASPF